MTNFLSVAESNDKLDLVRIDPRLLHQVMTGAELRWDRSGDVRRVPRHVFLQTVATLRDAIAARRAGIIPKIAEDAGRVTWDQTESIPVNL